MRTGRPKEENAKRKNDYNSADRGLVSEDR